MTSHHHENGVNGEKLTPMDSNNPLSRQVTYSLSQEQYERLFFQPSQAKGDLAKRLGNPTLLGVCGFLIPFTTVVLSILQWKGANSSSLVGFSGCFYFLGGIAMNIAGILLNWTDSIMRINYANMCNKKLWRVTYTNYY